MTTTTNRKAAQFITDRKPFSNGGKSFTGVKGKVYHLGQMPVDWQDRYLSDANIGIQYTVLSYNTPIAWFVNGEWVVPDTKYSVTTSRHQHVVRLAVA